MAVRNSHSRGFSLIYATIAMTAMLGIISLAVDLGRVQLAKTQLRQAADAAARYSVTGVNDGTYLSKAQSAASDNTCDGTAVSLQSADVVLGRWMNGAFTAGSTLPNAIQITAQRTAARSNAIPLTIAGLFGRGYCDVKAVSVARIASSGGGLGMVGLNAATLGTSGSVDSYNSDLGTYTSQHYSNGDVGSNGTLTLSNGFQVNGDAFYRSGFTTTGGAGVVAPGVASYNGSTATYPNPTLPATYTNYGAMNVSSGTYNLTPGNYYFSSLSVTGSVTVNCTGQVNVYVGGPVTISGNFSAAGNNPGNLRFMTTAASTVNITNGSVFAADIYCPNSDVSLNGSGNFYGRVIGKTLTTSGTFNYHYDEALNQLSSGSISTVK